MLKEIRTKRDKLIGKIDELTGVFTIKDGGKFTQIEVPPGGLRLWHTTSDGVTEEIHIPSPKRTATS